MSTTPMKAIRQYCLWCCLDQYQEVTLCPAVKCPLHAYRSGHRPGKGSSPLKAIRARCLDCVGGSHKEVEQCKTECALNVFRFGHSPNITEATKERQRLRMIGRIENNPTQRRLRQSN